MQKIESLKSIDLRIRSELPGEMRMQMVTIAARRFSKRFGRVFIDFDVIFKGFDVILSDFDLIFMAF